MSGALAFAALALALGATDDEVSALWTRRDQGQRMIRALDGDA